jgi:hypothetical protein
LLEKLGGDFGGIDVVQLFNGGLLLLDQLVQAEQLRLCGDFCLCDSVGLGEDGRSVGKFLAFLEIETGEGFLEGGLFRRVIMVLIVFVLDGPGTFIENIIHIYFDSGLLLHLLLLN